MSTSVKDSNDPSWKSKQFCQPLEALGFRVCEAVNCLFVALVFPR
jgi:hypothetical protein